MSALKQRLIGAARALTAFGGSSGGTEDLAHRLQHAEEHLTRRTRELEQARRKLARSEAQLAELRKRFPEGVPEGAQQETGINPANVVWIFGTGRSGSTWLMRMIEEIEGHTLWREPMVGLLFGYLYYFWADDKYRATKHFILGRNKEGWLRSIRNFVLEEANSRFPELGRDQYLFVKEPNGSVGAPLLTQALPESRMILLVRDPRDVVASALDANRQGSWVHNRLNMQGSPADEEPEAFVESRALKYLWYVGNSKLAYDAHEGPKVLVRYEDLRADTLDEMARVHRELGIEVGKGELSQAVERHAWERVPQERKGEGKFHRKAKPGGWQEDLTREQAAIVERITAPLLKQFYSYDGESPSLADELSNWKQRHAFFSPTP